MQKNDVFLLPGESCVSKEPAKIATLLGSCVAVCLFNKRFKMGGMNHFMLATSSRADDVPCGRHGDHSTRALIKAMQAYDPLISNIEAHVVGGGSVTSHLTLGMGIGARNIVMAKDILKEYGIPVKSSNVGGDFGRKLYFQTDTGEIVVRKIERSEISKAAEGKSRELSSRKIKVLVVDDSPIIRKIISDALKLDPTIEVVATAENPYAAREKILSCDPDVICLDIIMPRMDGIMFLKKLMRYKPIPVIIVSTVAQQGSKLRQQAYDAGAVDVIDKEELDLYGGLNTVASILIGKIKSASRVVLKRRLS